MTNGKRTRFRNEDELQSLLEAAWIRIRERVPDDTGRGNAIGATKRRFSIKSVSDEAGCSRSLIGYEKCRYPNLRKWLKDKIEAEDAGAISLLMSLSDEVALLCHKLKARRRAYNALCLKLGVNWNTSSESEDDLRRIRDGSMQLQIDELKERSKKLKRQLVLFDTQYANVILRQRLADLGLQSDMRPIRPASKSKRRASISVIGKSVKAEQQK